MQGLSRNLSLLAALAGAMGSSLPAMAQTVQPPSLEGLRSTHHEDVLLNPQDAAVMSEYGLQKSGQWAYERPGVTDHVFTFVFRDPTGAYGALTYWGTDIQPGQKADFLATSPRGLLALKGNLLFILESGGEKDGGIKKSEFLGWVQKSGAARSEERRVGKECRL